ncbi:MAG: Ribosomal RNA small subunit methyltransferase H [Xanthomonadales bacterium]|nr:Ribosomal RNA small subunit methyltransferase H [Xanthomonadales bacterium]
MTQALTTRAAGMGGAHQPVMLEAALEALAVRPQGRYVDATFGRGGHSRALLERLGGEGRVLAFDRDPEAVAAGRVLADADTRFEIHHRNFGDLRAELPEASVDGILFDFGVSSPQLDQAERGFSFLRDGPLDMRMDPQGGPSAAQWLAQVPEAELARVLADYGEEKFARRIARAIVARRVEQPFERTADLAEFIAAQLPRSHDGIHPATRSFQAIRIAVNDELRAIEHGLNAAHDLLAAHGRLVAISFHSLEDRLVKRYIQQRARPPQGSRRLPPRAAAACTLRDLGKRRADAAEIAANPRARSAVLRAAERIR